MKRKLDNIRFAPEIEVEFPKHKDSQKLINRHRIITGWEIDIENSLENGAEYRPKDRNKLYFNEDSLDQIKEIIGLIKAHHGNIKPSCGLHIHIDMSSFTDKEIAMIIKAFIKHQDYLYKEFKVLKGRLDDMAHPIPTTETKNITEQNMKQVRLGKSNSSSEYLSQRFFALNIQSLNKHNTLEFRLFNGTIQYSRIKAYVKWAIQFCLDYTQDKRKRRK
jgi:hypothetical protein